MVMNKGRLAVVLKILQEEYKHVMNGFNILGFIHNGNTAIIEFRNLTYFIWDNGGELGIEEINKKYNNDELAAMIPLTNFESELNALTIAIRCKQYFDGSKIDYSFKADLETNNQYCKYLKINNIANYKFV
jgi:hypothetical protein